MDTGSSLNERRARTQEKERVRQAQAQTKKAEDLRKKATKKAYEESMEDLTTGFAGMASGEGSESYAQSELEKRKINDLTALFGKAMTGVTTAGTKKPKGKKPSKSKRTPVKMYSVDSSVIRPGQLDATVRAMGSASQSSRNMARQRTTSGRSSQIDRRRGLTIQNPDDLSESMGNMKMGMGMPRRKSRKSRRKSRKSRRKSRKSRRKSRKSRRKSKKSRRKSRKSRRKSRKSRRKSRKKSKRKKSRRKSRSRGKASRKKSKSRRKVSKSRKPPYWPKNEKWPLPKGITIKKVLESMPPIYVLSDGRKVRAKGGLLEYR